MKELKLNSKMGWDFKRKKIKETSFKLVMEEKMLTIDSIDDCIFKFF